MQEHQFWKYFEMKEELYYAVCSTSVFPTTMYNLDESNIILILKKETLLINPASWCPTALQNSIYKIYAAILSKRLAHWCTDDKIISPMQKGFYITKGVTKDYINTSPSPPTTYPAPEWIPSGNSQDNYPDMN